MLMVPRTTAACSAIRASYKSAFTTKAGSNYHFEDNFRMTPTKPDASDGDERLDAAVFRVIAQVRHVRHTGVAALDRPDYRKHLLEEAPSVCEVDVAAIVRIDEAEIPHSGFELCENRAVPGTEEYLDSEKYQYQYRHRDWDRPGHIRDLVAAVNRIRHQTPHCNRIAT